MEFDSVCKGKMKKVQTLSERIKERKRVRGTNADEKRSRKRK